MALDFVPLVPAALGAVLLVAAARGLRRRRWPAAAAGGAAGTALLALALLLEGVALNLHSYRRLTYEQPVAELTFSQLGPQRYQVLLRLPDGRGRLLSLEGDEWQLDARVLKWRGAANLLGLDAQYRLERIRGRYRNLERERRGPHSVHQLAPAQGLDLWALVERHGRLLPWVDAVYGSAAYLPMVDGARYQVSLSQSGLVARPANPRAEGAVRGRR